MARSTPPTAPEADPAPEAPATTTPPRPAAIGFQPFEVPAPSTPAGFQPIEVTPIAQQRTDTNQES